jgi:uncharacterized protein (DUF433 family)
MATKIADGITVDPRVMMGKPVIKGTRMPVELVLAKLAANPDLDELFTDYPELTVEQVKACLQYASTLVRKDKRRRSATRVRTRSELAKPLATRYNRGMIETTLPRAVTAPS